MISMYKKLEMLAFKLSNVENKYSLIKWSIWNQRKVLSFSSEFIICNLISPTSGSAYGMTNWPHGHVNNITYENG